MANNRRNEAYGNHLTNPNTPNSRCKEEHPSHMWSETPQTRLPSFSNFIRPITNISASGHQAMDIDQAAGVTNNASTVIGHSDERDKATPTTVGVQESDRFSVEHNKSFDANGGSSSVADIGITTQVRVDNGELAVTTPAHSTDVQATKPRGSSSTDTCLSPSNPGSHDEDANMIDSLIHDIEEVQPSDEADGYTTPPLYAISEDGSNSSKVQEGRNKEKKPKENRHGTLKKALERAFVRRNRSSSQLNAQTLGVAYDLSNENANESSTIDQQTQGQFKGSTDPVSCSKNLPRRRLLGDAGRIAAHTARVTRTSFGHRELLSDSTRAKQQIAPTDPVLAASLDAMAREYANASKSSAASPLTFKKLTGKRHRDTDLLLRRANLTSICSGEKLDCTFGKQVARDSSLIGQDFAKCTPLHPNEGATEVKEAQDGSLGHQRFLKHQGNEGPTSHASGTLQARDQKCQNDLDFLASVVLSQEFPDDKKGIKAKSPVRANTHLSISNHGVMNQDGANLLNRAPVSQAMSVKRLLGTNVNCTPMNAVSISNQVSPHLTQRDDHQVPHFGSGNIKETEEAVENIAYGVQSHPEPSRSESGEPKSEVSRMDDESSASRLQEMQTQTTFENLAHQMTEESAPHTEDAVNPMSHVATHHVLSSEVARVNRTSSSEVQKNFDLKDKIRSAPSQIMKDMEAAAPAPEAENSSQGRRMMKDGGSSSKEFAKSTKFVPSFIHDEDRMSPVSLRAHSCQASQLGPSSLTQVKFSKAPKLPIRTRLYQDMDGSTPVPPHPQSRGLSAVASSSGQPGSSKGGKRPVRATIDEDVSEITPAPPRPQRSRSYQTGSSFKHQGLTNGAGSSKQGGTQGAEARNNSGRARATTTLPYTFRCDVCGAMFNRRFNLNKHIRNVHHNIRKFKCSMCEERFLQKSHRAAHLLAVHHKLRPFVCHLCAKNFSWLGVLRKHLQAIHKVPVQTTKRARRARPIKAGKNHPASDKVPPQSPRGHNAPPTVSAPSDRAPPPTPPSQDKLESK